jgi:hypothetical protein
MSQPGVFQLVFAKNFWMQVPYPFLKHLSPNELLLLCYLISWATYKDKTNDWFFCKMKQIMSELHMGQSRQTKTIASLRKKGYIKIRTDGMPPIRWIKINWDKLEEQSSDLYKEVEEYREERRKERQAKSSKKNGQIKVEEDDFEECIETDD